MPAMRINTTMELRFMDTPKRAEKWAAYATLHCIGCGVRIPTAVTSGLFSRRSERMLNIPPAHAMAFCSGESNLRRAEQSRRKENQCGNQFQRAVNRNLNQPKWQQNQPDDRVQHNRQQGHGPAQNEENTPEKKLDHILRLLPPFEGGTPFVFL